MFNNDWERWDKLEYTARDLAERYTNALKLRVSITTFTIRSPRVLLAKIRPPRKFLDFPTCRMVVNRRFFDAFYNINKEKAHMLLEAVIAHEVGHLAYIREVGFRQALIETARSRESVEREANKRAERITGIPPQKAKQLLQYFHQELEKQDGVIAKQVGIMTKKGVFVTHLGGRSGIL